MATFTQSLRARGEEGLVALLAARPDLASPPPSTVRSLAARATSRTSLDRALAAVDAQVMQVLEAVVALDGASGRGSREPDVVLAVGAGEDPAAAASVVRAVRTALLGSLLWVDPAAPDEAWSADSTDATLRPAPGLAEALGPYPAGLGPSLTVTLARRTPQGLTRLAHDVGLHHQPGEDDATLVQRLGAHLASAATVQAVIAQAPPGTRAVLDALLWGTPVGRSPEAAADAPSTARSAVDWLLRHGMLSLSDAQHVVLPREVALVLRGGRTHRAPSPAPQPSGVAVDRRTVEAESARHAEEIVRLVAALVDLWAQDPAPVLRAGGIGQRELRRVGLRLQVPEPRAALVVELAGAAGLVVEDGEDPAMTPTVEADEWLELSMPERWAVLAQAWLSSERAAWLVGTRTDRGTLRPALDPESRRPWAPRLRVGVLDVLSGAAEPAGTGSTAGDGTDRRAALPDGERGALPHSAPLAGAIPALTAQEVHDVLRWRTPRAVPPEHAVAAVLAEAGSLGVLGAGALGAVGRALLRTAAPDEGDEQREQGGTDVRGPAEVLAQQLPPPVEEILLQADLTGIVPGRPSAALATLLDASADVESRGAGLTVRFTEQSVRRALDAGRTAEDVLADLSRHARTGVPQPLEYLVLDTARRHGRVRVGMASSYLRADDPALLAGLAEDTSLRALGLLRLAPTVIASQAAPATLLAALRDRGLAPVTEGTSGEVVLATAGRRRARPVRGRRHVAVPAPPPADEARRRRLQRLARDLLAADRRETAEEVAHQARTGDPAHAAAGVGPHGHPPAGPAAGAGTGPDATGGRATGGRPAGARPGGRPAGWTVDGGPGPGSAPAAATEPVTALELLREAAAEGREVWLEVVGASGAPVRRRVRPLRVDAGRVRCVDAERETEMTVAVHRIAGVTAT